MAHYIDMVGETVDLPVKLSFSADGSVRAQATIKLSLDEMKVERPSLMFKKVNDELIVEADVLFSKG